MIPHKEIQQLGQRHGFGCFQPQRHHPVVQNIGSPAGLGSKGLDCAGNRTPLHRIHLGGVVLLLGETARRFHGLNGLDRHCIPLAHIRAVPRGIHADGGYHHLPCDFRLVPKTWQQRHTHGQRQNHRPHFHPFRASFRRLFRTASAAISTKGSSTAITAMIPTDIPQIAARSSSSGELPSSKPGTSTNSPPPRA